MKPALFAIGSMLSLFISMFCALALFAARATNVFEGIPPSREKVIYLTSASVLFGAATVYCFLRAYWDVMNAKGE